SAGHGTVTLLNGQITYAPASLYSGADSFSYTISDGNGGTASATVNVLVTHVNHRSEERRVAKDTTEDTALSFPASDLTANDSDVDGDALTVVSLGSAGQGTVTLLNGQITYAPAALYSGVDSFSYTISDGNGGTAGATVSVLVTHVNH